MTDNGEAKPQPSIEVVILPDGGLTINLKGQVGPHHIWAAAHFLQLMGDDMLRANAAAQQRAQAQILQVASNIQRDRMRQT